MTLQKIVVRKKYKTDKGETHAMVFRQSQSLF
jgi:hypothetical protein